jgi:hypothetical protein
MPSCLLTSQDLRTQLLEPRGGVAVKLLADVFQKARVLVPKSVWYRSAVVSWKAVTATAKGSICT